MPSLQKTWFRASTLQSVEGVMVKASGALAGHALICSCISSPFKCIHLKPVCLRSSARLPYWREEGGDLEDICLHSDSALNTFPLLTFSPLPSSIFWVFLFHRHLLFRVSSLGSEVAAISVLIYLTLEWWYSMGENGTGES